MPTAIVTITCPSCGGKVEGVRATDEAQTIPCKYCNTKLHVPRVGDQIVRETVVVRETVITEPPVEPLRPRPKPILPAVVVAALGTVGMLILLAKNNAEADHMMKQFDDERAQETACKAECTRTCNALPPRPKTEMIGDPEIAEQSDRAIRDADLTLCTLDCEDKHDCMHLHRQLR